MPLLKYTIPEQIPLLYWLNLMNQRLQKQIHTARMLSVTVYLRKLKSLPKNDPTRGTVLITLGWIFDQRALKSKPRKQLQKKAKFYFRQALRHKASKREALRGLAMVFMHEGKYARALAYCEKAHRIEKSAETYNDFGNL